MRGRRTQSTALTTDERYCIVGQLGTGGMGVVVEAIDLKLHRRVALKFTRTDKCDETSGAQQLQREAEAMTRAKAAGVCRLLGFASYQKRPCLVMDRLVGHTLERRLSRGPLSIAEVLSIGEQLSRALEAVHRVGLVHQDIKPANVFLTAAGSATLLDFGVAVPSGTLPEGPTAEVYGTTYYISPERILRRASDPRSDLFSLGVVLYQMIAGERPFSGTTPAEVIFNVLDAEPASLSERAPHCPAGLIQIVKRLLHKSARLRYQSASKVREALARVRQAPSDARVTSSQRQIGRRGGQGHRGPVESGRPRLDHDAPRDAAHVAAVI